MNQDIGYTRERNLCRRRHVAGVVAALFLLSGCTAVPDEADPTDWFTIDPVPTKVGLTEGQARSQPTGFPNLASVPNQPPGVLSPEARTAVQANLAADRANAVYSDETLTGSTRVRAPIRTSAAQGSSGAPPAPRIGSDLTAATRVPPAPARTQPAQTDPVPAPVAAGGQLVAVIYFGHGSSQLDGKDRAVLRDVAALHQQHGGTIRVVGHARAGTVATDPISHDLTDDEMSLRRANSVAAGLIALGAARDRVRAEARGGKQPVDREIATTGEAGNRRAEIFLEN